MGKVAEMRVIVGDKDDEQQESAGDRAEELRILEALLFAAEAPLDEKALAARLPAGVDVRALLVQLQREYAPRGVNLVRVGGKWTLRTANDLAWLLTHKSVVTRKLSRAAIETLAIVAYHQPVRAPRSRKFAASLRRRARSTCCSKPAGCGCAGGARPRGVR